VARVTQLSRQAGTAIGMVTQVIVDLSTMIGRLASAGQ
jgi:hypothetical protein